METDFFNIVAGVLQGDTLVPYMYIIYLDYILRTSNDLMKENGFILKKCKKQMVPAEAIMDADNINDMALLADTPNQTESLLDILGQVAGSISLHVNADKTEYMCFKQEGNISTLSGISV